MFELKLLQGDTKVFTFDEERVWIGSDEAACQLHLTSENIHAKHLVISWEKGHYTIQNVSHDPHTSINGSPFWKKQLHTGDILKLGSTELEFTQLREGKEGSTPSHDLKYHTLEDLYASPKKKSPPVEQTLKAPEPQWHVWVLFLSVCFLFVVIFSASLYITLDEKTHRYQNEAAHNLSDIALLLKYAQIEQIPIDTSHWPNLAFFQSLSEQFLDSDNSLSDSFGLEGRFLRAPYRLRFYADPDTSHFILIAQPQASFLQTLLPKPSLIIDSDAMILREHWELKDLNKLLTRSNLLDASVFTTLEPLITQGTPIPLTELAKKNPSKNFQPPQELSIIDPQAELYLYNAPRYHKLFTPLLQKLHEDRTELPTYSEKVASCPHLVLYSPQGLQHAIQTKKLLGQFLPHHQILVGYLTPDRESHLLMMQLHTEQDPSEAPIPSIDLQHPLHQTLQELAKKRQDAVAHLSRPLIELLETHVKKGDRLFLHLYENQSKSFKEQLKHLHEELEQQLKQLFDEHVTQSQLLTHTEFLNLLEQYNLEMGLEDAQLFQGNLNPQETNPHLKLHQLLHILHDSQSLEQIDQSIALIQHLLNTHPFSPHELREVEEELRLLLLYKLDNVFILPTLDEEQASQLDWTLGRILKNGKLQNESHHKFHFSFKKKQNNEVE